VCQATNPLWGGHRQQGKVKDLKVGFFRAPPFRNPDCQLHLPSLLESLEC